VDASFTVTGDKGAVTHTGLLAHNYDVRVYNRDFVTDNLSFLVNQDVNQLKHAKRQSSPAKVSDRQESRSKD
jgi:hypothetical protein